jgi:hypothetical protein
LKINKGIKLAEAWLAGNSGNGNFEKEKNQIVMPDAMYYIRIYILQIWEQGVRRPLNG